MRRLSGLPSSTQSAAAQGPIEPRIGPVIRRLRLRSGLSLRAYAEKVGFSPSFISQVENDVASPSIASLARMMSVLGVTLAELFAGCASSEPMIVRAAERPSFRSAWSKARIDALIPRGRSEGLEALMVTLDPGGLSGRETESVGVDQFVMMLKGTVLLSHNEHVVTLRRGDSLMLPAGTPHRWQNRSRSSAQVLIVSTRR